MAPKDNQHQRQHAEDVHTTRPITQERSVTAEVQQTVVATAVPAGTSSELALPLNAVSRADISRSLRELESIVEYFHQASLRGGQAKELPVLGKVLDSIASVNGLNLLHPEDRDKLKEFLIHVKAKAPVVHMSFPSKPGEPFITKIVQWFRTEAHPFTVLHVGLQPELAAGCLVRTSNKQFDFSFRRRFEQSKQKLVSALEEADKRMQAEIARTTQGQTAVAASTPATTTETVVVTNTLESSTVAEPVAASEPAQNESKDPEKVGL